MKKILDLFCGAGGAAMGYHRAGFEVVGVDIAPQPNYPFEFEQADALEYLDRCCVVAGVFGLEHELADFDAIHASPPCQHFTRYGNSVKDLEDRYDDHLSDTRSLLFQTGLPYVIENVQGAPLEDPVKLCGSMFEGDTHDLQRHRLFETNWGFSIDLTCDHSKWEPNRYPGGRWKARKEKDPTITPSSKVRKTVEIGRWNIPLETQKWAMGVDWKIELRELSEAIPPAYTEYVGKKLMEHL